MNAYLEIARACATLIGGSYLLIGGLGIVVVVGMACFFPDHTRLNR